MARCGLDVGRLKPWVSPSRPRPLARFAYSGTSRCDVQVPALIGMIVRTVGQGSPLTDDTEASSFPVGDCVHNLQVAGVDAAPVQTGWTTWTGEVGVVAEMVDGLLIGERSPDLHLSNQAMQHRALSHSDVALRLRSPGCCQQAVAHRFSSRHGQSHPLLRCFRYQTASLGSTSGIDTCSTEVGARIFGSVALGTGGGSHDQF